MRNIFDQNVIHAFFASIMVLASTASAYGDIIKLKNGRELRGIIREEDAKMITVEVRMDVHTIQRTLVESITEEPAESYYLYEGDKACEEKRYDTSLIFYEKALEESPDNSHILARIARVQYYCALELYEQKSYAEAQKHLEDFILFLEKHGLELAPERQDTRRKIMACTQNLFQHHVERGDLRYSRQEYAMAINEYKEAIELFPSMADDVHPKIAVSYLKLGNVYFHNKLYTKAEKLYQAAFRYDRYTISLCKKNYSQILFQKAMRFAADSKEDRAIDELEELVTIAPEQTEAWYLLGLLLVKKSAYQKALPVFQRIVHNDPGYRKAQLIYERIGDVNSVHPAAPSEK